MKTTLLKPLAAYLIGLLLSHSVLASNTPLPHSLVVITANDRPLQHSRYAQRIVQSANGQFAVYTVNAVDDFEAQISEGLPADESEAKQIFEQRLARMGKDKFRQRLLKAYQGLLTAARYQIDRYPAVIFDSQLVIYGVTDLKQTLQLYKQWNIQQFNITSNQGATP